MKVLAVAPQPFFTPRGTPFSVYHRTRQTAGLGFDVDLLTYGEGVDPELPGVRIIRIPRLPFLGPVKIGPSFGKLVRDVVMVIWTVAMLVRRRYCIVHAHEEAVFWCRVLKPIFRFRLIYDMHSSLPQQLENFEFTQSRFLIGLFRALENSALRNADAVITISPTLASYARKLMPDPSRHFLIENSILDEVMTPGEASGQSRGFHLPADRDWIIYAGTFEPYQGLDLLLRGFARIASEHPRAHLVLLGGEPAQIQELQEMAREEGISRACSFTGKVAQGAVRELMDEATVLVSTRSRGTNTPLKVYELLASGVPFVATRVPSHTQVLDDEVCFMVEPNVEGVAEGLSHALRGGPEADSRVQAAHDLYQTEYSKDAYVAKLAAALDVATGAHPPGSDQSGADSTETSAEARS